MGAIITSSQPQPLYEYVGKNFAPLEPLTTLRESGEPTWDRSPFCEAMMSKYQDYKQRDMQAWQDSVDIGRMVANLRTGKLLLLRNALDNRYLFVKPDGKYSDHKTIGGLFQFYSTKLTAEWLSSRPEIDPILPSDDDQIEEFIAAVKIVQDSYSKKFYNTSYEEEESLSAQDFGMWITRYRFDPQIQDIVCELLPYPACRFDIRFTPENSSYFIYESKCATATLKHLLKADINSDDDFPDQYGLQIIEMIARQGGNASGYGKERPFGEYDIIDNENVVTEMWLQPEAYADLDLPTSEGTISGIPLEKGVSLLEMFPTGMCVVGINGMQTIIGVHAESHKDHIVSGYYHKQSFSGIGKGVSDAVDVMKEMNDLHSQTMAYIKAHGTPAWAYNQSLLSEEQARNLGKPRKNVAIDFSNAPDGVTNVNQVVQALVPGNPANSVFQYGEALNNFLQMAFQVTTFSDGMPGVNNTTATGAQIGEANERMMLVPQHRNKADHRMRADKVIYNLFKKFVDKPRFFATRDKNGITKGKYLSGSQFDGVDIEFTIVADSEIPRTRFTKELSTTKLLNFSGGVMGLIQAAQADPELTSAVVKAFGSDLPISKPDDIARVCRQRVEQAKKLLQNEIQLQSMMSAVTGQQVEPQALAMSVVGQLIPPITPAEPYAQQKVTWLSRFLDCDEMMFAPVEMRHVIEQFAANQGQAMAMQPMVDQQNQMMQAQNQQKMAMQQAQAQAQIDQTRAQAEAQSAGQMQLKQAEYQMNQEQADSDFEREMTAGAIEHDRNMQLEELRLAAQAEQKAIDRSKRAYPVKK